MAEGRLKGNSFENEVCRYLSAWVAGKAYSLKVPLAHLPFRRRSTSITPLEGHWEGAGDVLWQPTVEFPFAVECKKQEGWDLDGIMDGGSWKPWAWWAQAKEQARRVGLLPLLVFTRNRRPIYAMVDWRVVKCLKPEPVRSTRIIAWRSKECVAVLRLRDLITVPRSGLKRVRALRV